MKKLNLVLFILVLIALSGLAISISTVYAEDQQPAGKQPDKDKLQKYDPCANCESATKSMKMAKDMDMKKSGNMMDMGPMMQKMGGGMGSGMAMGQGMMCPMMEKMMKGDAPMPGSPVDILAYADKLQLTAEQKSVIEATHLAHKKDMIKKNSELEIARIDMDVLMSKDDPDITAVSDQIKKIANMDAEVKIAQFKIGVDVKSVLTKDQLATLKTIKENERRQMKMDNMPQNPAPAPDKSETKPMPEHMEHNMK
jgi:Spy/CpxP family protein refolding chaperone